MIITGDELKRLIPIYEMQGIVESLTEAVLRGNVKGWAYVDNPACPSVALVLHAHAGGAFWLGAEPGPEDAANFVKTLLAYRSNREFCTWIEFGNCPESMARLILKRVPEACRSGRLCLRHEKAAFESAPKPTPKPDIRIVLYREGDEIPEEIRMESLLFWDNEAGVVHDSAAVAAWDGQGQLRGICITAALAQRFWEIDISTDSEHRQQGIGYAMSYAYIAECLERGCIPRWNCRRENTASYNLALKLGFRPANSYELITWDSRDTQ